MRRWRKEDRDGGFKATPRYTNHPQHRENVLQLLVSRLFATCGLHSVKGTNNMEEDCNNVLPGEDLINTLPDENPIDTLQDEDCISRLPDEVLSSIISLLTIRDAVKTSILSRRWVNLCATLSDINFDIETLFGVNFTWDSFENHILGETIFCPKYNSMFVIGVNQFLNHYLGTKLHSFRISFCFDAEFTSCVDRWISFAVRMGVEKLDINFKCKGYNYYCVKGRKENYYSLFWSRLFRSVDLKHLCLHSCIIVVPDSRFMTNGLTTMDMNNVPLVNNELQHIFHSCLNLESLTVTRCRLPGKLCVSGVARLKFLVVDTCPGLEEIELSAINLTAFEFCDSSREKLSFSCVPKLEKVFFFRSFCSELPYIRELASNLPQLKTLRLFTTAFWVGENAGSPYVLRTLKQLELFLYQDEGSDHVNMIDPLLRACPLLQRLNVVMPLPRPSQNRKREKEEPPQHLHTQLEEVHIGGFCGSWNNIEFAIRLLKSAVLLKQMIIESRYEVYMGGGQWCSGNGDIWPPKIRERIFDHLQGNNFSEHVEVIIR